MLAIEKSKDFKDYGNTCLTEKPNNKTILNGIRKDAATHFKNKKYNDAIDLLNIGVIDNGNASILDYNSLATYYLYSKQYDKALKAINKGIELDDSELRLQLNLAHYYMLTNQFGKAKTLHKKYQSQNITAKTSWKVQAKIDIQEFKKAGIQSDDLDKVLEVLGK
jgi:tetratricopeptide (TPR) repeat protein